MNKVTLQKKVSLWLNNGTQVLGLSLIFAACAQLYIPLPFNMVPIYPHPLPLFLAVLWFRRVAVAAYCTYLLEGACGVPVFARMNGGLTYMIGPTGGYLIGFLLAMIIFNYFLSLKISSGIFKMGVLLLLSLIYFSCGIAHLSHFVPVNLLLSTGLYPFLIGDACKLLILWKLWK